MTNFRTEENISIITSSMANIIIVSLLISFFYTSLYFLIIIFSHVTINLCVLILGCVIFGTCFISLLFVRTEYFLALKKDYIIRPPLQILLITVVAYIVILTITPDRFMGGEKVSVPILTLLLVPSVIIGMISQQAFYILFMICIKIISKIYTKDILGESIFMENIEFKFHELLRHDNQFSVLLISFTIPEYAVGKIRRSLIFTLFFDILRRNIRKTDMLGILENGRTAGIISNGNDTKKAEVQAKRLVRILSDNQLFMRKLNVYDSVIKCGLVRSNKEHETHKKLIENAFESLSKALASETSQIIIG